MSPRRRLDPGTETVTGDRPRRPPHQGPRAAAGARARSRSSTTRTSTASPPRRWSRPGRGRRQRRRRRSPAATRTSARCSRRRRHPAARRRRADAALGGRRRPRITVDGQHVIVDGQKVGEGVRQTLHTLEERVEDARQRMGTELERFAQNTLEYLRKEGKLLTHVPEVPEVGVDFAGRHVLLVVRGVDYREDLRLLRQTGYLQEKRPVAHRRRRRRRRPASTSGYTPRRDHRRLRLGVGAHAALRRQPRRARLRRRQGAGRRAPRRPRPRATRCSSRPAPARTSPCCSPTSRAPS